MTADDPVLADAMVAALREQPAGTVMVVVDPDTWQRIAGDERLEDVTLSLENAQDHRAYRLVEPA